METWKVLTATLEELEEQLNGLAAEGYHVFSIQPVGTPEPLSNIPRDRKSLAQRTTLAVVARKPAG